MKKKKQLLYNYALNVSQEVVVPEALQVNLESVDLLASQESLAPQESEEKQVNQAIKGDLEHVALQVPLDPEVPLDQ